jgi:small subunit ribosomal protein S2
MSNLPQYNIKQMLEAGVHFGHKINRWNPKMQPYIYGTNNGVHIIDLKKTVPLLYKALNKIKEVAKANGRILFVSTKKQASDVISNVAKRSGQYYVNYRWLGGTLTNWYTISASIKTLQNLEASLNDPESNLTKKEKLKITREMEKFERVLGGIRNMGGVPDLVIIIDIVKEDIAVQEAKKLGIPIIAIVDSNADPDLVDYIIPGNDDSIKAIDFYCRLFSDSIIAGIEESINPTPTKLANENKEQKMKVRGNKREVEVEQEEEKKDNKKPTHKKPSHKPSSKPTDKKDAKPKK